MKVAMAPREASAMAVGLYLCLLHATRMAQCAAPPPTTAATLVSSCPAHDDPDSGRMEHDDDSIDGACTFPFRYYGEDVWTCVGAKYRGRARAKCYHATEGDEDYTTPWGWCDDSCPLWETDQ